MFKNKTLDRTFSGFAILSSWFLVSVVVWAFVFHGHIHNWFDILGIICGFVLGLCSVFITVIGWRYVLTGNEFADI